MGSYKTEQVWRAVRGLRASTGPSTGTARERCVRRKATRRKMRSLKLEIMVKNLMFRRG